MIHATGSGTKLLLIFVFSIFAICDALAVLYKSFRGFSEKSRGT